MKNPIFSASFISADTAWIPATPYFKKHLSLKGEVKSAKLHISSLGVFVAEIDGVRVGDDFMTPGWTNYNKRLQYFTYDVTNMLSSESDLIVFALYPLTFISWVEQYGHLLKRGVRITDVSGVKSGIITKIQDLLPDGVEFISAHPMAGRERSGVSFSDDSVFKGANYIVIPTEKNTEEAILLCEELGRLLGFSRITRLSAQKHDRMIAFLSQLTHCIAVCLMNCNDAPDMEKYTGDSFRDLTRIAKINENMWSELFLLNKDALLAEMDAFAKEFMELRRLLQNGDGEAMKEKMRASTEKRMKFDKPKG